MDEAYAKSAIAKELARIRAKAPNEETVRREWTIHDRQYREQVIEGGNPAAIRTYYVTRQAYFLYAAERGFSLEVKPWTQR